MYTSITALNVPIDILIVQRVWKCLRDEWGLKTDFRSRTIQRYTKKRYLKGQGVIQTTLGGVDPLTSDNTPLI